MLNYAKGGEYLAPLDTIYSVAKFKAKRKCSKSCCLELTTHDYIENSWSGSLITKRVSTIWKDYAGPMDLHVLYVMFQLSLGDKPGTD